MLVGRLDSLFNLPALFNLSLFESVDLVELALVDFSELVTHVDALLDLL